MSFENTTVHRCAWGPIPGGGGGGQSPGGGGLAKAKKKKKDLGVFLAKGYIKEVSMKKVRT